MTTQAEISVEDCQDFIRRYPEPPPHWSKEFAAWNRNRASIIAHLRHLQKVEAELEKCRRDAERYRWLEKNISYYNTSDASRPALQDVSKRIWYHASDNIDDRTLSATIDRAISAGEVKDDMLAHS